MARSVIFFDDTDMDEQRAKQKSFLSWAMGGPEEYTGKDMRDAHAPMVERGLDHAHFDAVAGHLQTTLQELDVDEMRDLAAQYENFEYIPCISGDDAAAEFRVGRADANALSDEADLSGWRVFLCGHPAMVNATRKMAYLAGAAMADIMADPFDFQELRIQPRSEPEPLDVW